MDALGASIAIVLIVLFSVVIVYALILAFTNPLWLIAILILLFAARISLKALNFVFNSGLDAIKNKEQLIQQFKQTDTVSKVCFFAISGLLLCSGIVAILS